jgi:hypothetical protein
VSRGHIDESIVDTTKDSEESIAKTSHSSSPLPNP